MKHSMLWQPADSPILNMVQPSLATIGWDEDGLPWVSAEYGRNIEDVLAQAKADFEDVVYKHDMPFVRLAWLRRRFPECDGLMEMFELYLS